MSAAVKYLVDTNVISELRRKKADERVLAFLQDAEESTLYLSALTVGELRKGIARKRMTDAAGASALTAWADGLEYGFGDRILGIDTAIARLWGELSAERPRAVVDTLLAATAMVHGLTLVTRNEADVQDLDVKVLNPFAG